MQKRKSFLTTVALSTIVLSLALPQPAHASESSEMVGLINQLRKARSVGPVSVSGDLTTRAEKWARRMADQRKLSHGPNVANVSDSTKTAGENVGMGSSVGQIMNTFAASTKHLGNMINPDFNVIGVGVARVSNGLLYICVLFAGSSSAHAVADVPQPPKKRVTNQVSRSKQKPSESSAGTSSLPPSVEPAVPNIELDKPVSLLIAASLREVGSITLMG